MRRIRSAALFLSVALGLTGGCARTTPLDSASAQRERNPNDIATIITERTVDPELPPGSTERPRLVTDGYICEVTRSPRYGWVNFVLTEELECEGASTVYTLSSSDASSTACGHRRMSPDDLRTEYRSLLDGLAHRLRYVVGDYDRYDRTRGCLVIGAFRQDTK